MTSDLTPRQKSVLEYIISFQRENRMAPTVREICAHLGLSGPAGIHRVLNILKDKGYILADPGKKRSWRINKDITGSGIPLVGTIAAGQPVEAIENLEGELPVSPGLFGCKQCFSLRVKGDSMINAHILDGDLVIIRPQQRVENGEIAAVIVQNQLPEATLKIVRRTRCALYLESANPAFSPLVFKGPQRKYVSIIGKYVGIVRKA